MLNAGHPGFAHAPVIKAIVGIVILSTVFGAIIGSQTRLTLRMHDVTEYKQVWRLVTHNFVFTTPGEFLFGIVLLYFFRQFERQMGSSRFAAFAVITASVYTAILAAFQVMFPRIMPASGPYSLVFGSIVYFFFETPKIYHFQLLGGLELSDKAFAYLIALQLVFSSPPRSAVSCSAALAAGLSYRIPPIRDHADIPDFIVAPFARYVLPLMGTTQRSTILRSSRGRRHLDIGNPRAHRNGLAIGTGEAGPPPISEGNIDTLIAMGFSREQSISALVRCNDDVQRATEQLLNTSG